MHGVGGIGGADVDMHQHALAAPGDKRIAPGHVRRRILMRAVQNARHRLASLLAMRHFLDDRGVIGTEIAEQIFDPKLGQAFQEIIGGRELRGVALAGDGCGHDGVTRFSLLGGDQSACVVATNETTKQSITTQ